MYGFTNFPPRSKACRSDMHFSSENSGKRTNQISSTRSTYGFTSFPPRSKAWRSETKSAAPYSSERKKKLNPQRPLDVRIHKLPTKVKGLPERNKVCRSVLCRRKEQTKSLMPALAKDSQTSHRGQRPGGAKQSLPLSILPKEKTKSPMLAQHTD